MLVLLPSSRLRDRAGQCLVREIKSSCQQSGLSLVVVPLFRERGTAEQALFVVLAASAYVRMSVETNDKQAARIKQNGAGGIGMCTISSNWHQSRVFRALLH